MNPRKKYAIVTGASTGIGRAVAIELGKTKIYVGLVARSKDKLEETKQLIEVAGGSASVFPLDLRNTDEIERLAKTLRAQWGRVDMLINVAGVYHDKTKAHYNIPFVKYTTGEIKNTYDVGNATTFLTHALLPLMEKDSHVISISGTFESGNSGWLPYFVSKRSIEDFTVGLAQELQDKGIFVNCISPSDTATETYKKFFPEYAADAMDPKRIGEFIVELVKNHQPPTGKVFVLKNGKDPCEAFHI